MKPSIRNRSVCIASAGRYHSFDDLPLTPRVEDLMPILGIGRNTAYELVRSGQIRSVKIGRQIRIPKQEVFAFLHQQPG